MPMLSKAIRDIVERFISQRGEMVGARLSRLMAEAPEQLVSKLGAEPGMVELLMRQPKQLVGALSGPESAGFARLIGETAPKFEERLSNLRSGTRQELRGAAPQPEIAAPSIDELLQRPQGRELGEIQDRMTELLGRLSSVRSHRSAIPGQIKPELERLRALIAPPGPLDENTAAGLASLRGERPPEPPPDFPVKRFPLRGGRPLSAAPSKAPMAELLRERGLKRTVLPPDMQDFLQKLVDSGQLPPEVNRSEGNIMLALKEKLFGSKPRALLGQNKRVGIHSSREGLEFMQRRRASPEAEMRKIGSPKMSGFLQRVTRLSRMMEEAQALVPAYKVLGDTRSEQEIVADLLRGGPESISQITSRAKMLGQAPEPVSEFESRVTGPVRERRAKQGMPLGEPLPLEQIMAVLRRSNFLQPDLTHQQGLRQEFLGRVVKKVQERQRKGAR